MHCNCHGSIIPNVSKCGGFGLSNDAVDPMTSPRHFEFCLLGRQEEKLAQKILILPCLTPLAAGESNGRVVPNMTKAWKQAHATNSKTFSWKVIPGPLIFDEVPGIKPSADFTFAAGPFFLGWLCNST